MKKNGKIVSTWRKIIRHHKERKDKQIPAFNEINLTKSERKGKTPDEIMALRKMKYLRLMNEALGKEPGDLSIIGTKSEEAPPIPIINLDEHALAQVKEKEDAGTEV